jgi:hypothetical protein
VVPLFYLEDNRFLSPFPRDVLPGTYCIRGSEGRSFVAVFLYSASNYFSNLNLSNNFPVVHILREVR